MIRFLAIVALVLATIVPAAPAFAEDDLARQLIGSCIGCRLPKDLHGRDLHGLRFVGSDLRDVDLSGANLRDAQFTGANLDGTRFDGADLRNARFVGVQLRHVSFARATMDGATFVGASISQSDIDGAAGRVILHSCTGCSLKGLDLHDADLRGARLIGSSLSDAKLAGARLNDAQLVGVSARDADLSRADLGGANLVGASLHSARLAGATIGDAILCSDDSTSYQNGVLERRTTCTDLRGVDLHGLDFRAARHCAHDTRDDKRTCRTVTRRELVEYGNADLTGAQAPA